MLIKLIRNALGAVIYLIDLITRPRKLKRSEQEQSAVEQQASKMALYQHSLCPFCIKTRRAIHKLNVPIETRTLSNDSPYRQELEQQGGKIQAPCLRVETSEGTKWIYESSDIITYLETRFVS